MSDVRFGIDCLKCGSSMKSASGNLDDGFVYNCPKCNNEVCLNIVLPPPQSIIQQIRKKSSKKKVV